MSNLTQEQEHAITLFKGNLHLPDGGFHRLILALCIEFQLPFQKVRAVLKESQVFVEHKIINEFESVDENTLTKANWLSIIKQTLSSLSKDNKPIMESLVNNLHYIKAVDNANKPIGSEYDREMIIADLSQAYETEVYKTLSAMLYTSDLYWLLSNELIEMDNVRCQPFQDYPQHIEAIMHLTTLLQRVASLSLTIK